MEWCSYCKDNGGFFSTNYICDLNEESIPQSYLDNYCKYDYKVSNCPFYKEYGPYESSSCFITTVTCNILGKNDNDPVMEKLRDFRNNVLQKNEEYYEILKLYDVIGPMIANNLMNDAEKELFTPILYPILERITKLIDKKDYESAIEKYRVMTLLLINRYDLKHLFNEIADDDFGYNDNEFNPITAGHGITLRNPEIKKS